MSSLGSFASTTPHFNLHHRRYVTFRPNPRPKYNQLRCDGRFQTDSKSSSEQETSKPENALLKIAWYSSELLGIAVSLFKPQPTVEFSGNDLEILSDGLGGAVERAVVIESIKEDFQRSYFVTGNLTLNAYEEDCEFADPAGSFKGLCRFKRNCTNFGSLLEKSNMKLMKWEDFEDKGIGHWRFSCILSFPWRPILSATGYTEYYFNPQSGKVCRHVENWNVPKMTLLKQILRPSKNFWGKKPIG